MLAGMWMRAFCQHRPGGLRRVVGAEDLKQSPTECEFATTGRDGYASSQAVTAQSGSLYAVLMYGDVVRRPCGPSFAASNPASPGTRVVAQPYH